MESPSPAPSPMHGSMSASAHSTSSRGVRDDVSSLTSFNPFSDEDEHDQSSYNLVTSFLSKMKSISGPLSSAVASTSSSNPSNNGYAASSAAPSSAGGVEARRPSMTATATTTSNISTSTKNSAEKPHSLLTVPSRAAPPVVDTSHLLPMGSFSLGLDEQVAQGHSSRQNGPAPGMPHSPLPFDSLDSGVFGTSIPGFPIPDDTRSIKTSTSFQRSNSVSKVMRKIRGEGLSKDYWMDDENAKECYDCKSVFTAWRRKHHCRICGQIFCSRCASNIINGGRFGHNGQIRVCNLCLEKLAAVDDDDDDRRSIISSFTDHALRHSFTPGRFPPPSPFAPVGYHPTHGHYVAGYGSEGADSRPVSPHFVQGPNGEVQGLPAMDKIAPFRRPMLEEDAYANGLVQEDPASVSVGKQANGMDIPTRSLSLDVSVSTIQFPIGSPDQESPMPSRFPHPMYGEYEVGTPFIRSRVHSRLESISAEPLYRVRRESTVYMAELNTASMNHLAIMLRQMLTTEGIPNVKDWEGVLLKMALRIAREMTFISLPHRQGQDMDVRRYVKIKKIPGGTPTDSEYVDGAVITKNVAHKQMARDVPHPRVMLVTFPLEFHRVEGQYMHFGQIVRQEKEYLTNLASRIAALRPHVVLVEKSVSRIALDALTKNNIAVARSVKPTAVQTVARMTQGDVFSSMDKLALEPRLGHCTKFRIQTFDHHLIPGQRKTYMRFEGCLADMGCTILLRGGDIQTLRRIKKVMRFLTFIVRNLKLETHLWKDTYLTLGPSLGPEATPHGHHSRHSSDFASHLQSGLGLITPASTSFPQIAASIVGHAPTLASSEPTASIVAVGDEEEGKEVLDEAAQQALLSRRIEESLEPYKTTFISVSATLRFPPPYPIQKMKDLDDELIAAKRAWEDEVIRSEERLRAKKKSLEAQQQIPPTIAITSVKELEQQQQEVVGDSLEQDDISAQIEALPSTHLAATPNGVESFAPYGPYASPAAMQEGESYFSPMNSILSPLSNSHFTSPLIDQAGAERQEKKEPLKTVEDLEHQSRYTLTKWKHEEHRRIWEWYLRKNKDDFVVEKYQNISIRHFTVPINGLKTIRPCKLPTLEYITFYGENDLTLGQFIEKSASETLTQFLDPKAICEAKNCDQPLARHGKAFVHNETRVFVEVEQWDSQGPKVHSLLMSYPGAITTWTKCGECGLQTPYANVSQELQRYSFSKFLEAYFYPPDVHLMREAGCQHNIYRHHYRYFSAKGMTIRFQADRVDLQELVFPPFRIRVRPETQLEIKNREFNHLHKRNERWYDGVVHDLHQYAMEATIGEEEADQKLRQTINILLAKAETERRDVIQLINGIYRDTAPTDTLALNQVHAYRQDRIVAWQQDFDKLPKLKGGKDGDRTSGKRTTAFDSMRAMWKYDFQGPFGDSSFYSAQSEAEDGSTKSRRATGESTFSTSDVSESEKESVPESASTATTISSATSWPTESDPGTAENEKAQKLDEGGPNTPLPITPVSAPALDDEEAPKPETHVEPQAESPESVKPLVPAIEVGPSDAEKEDSEAPDPDPDSDSTIGVGARARRKAAESQRKPRKVNFQFDDFKMPNFNLGPPSHRSRIPKKGSTSRSTSNQPKVAELVRKYSDSLPPQTVQDLAKSALGPTPMSESEQEYPTNNHRRTPQRTRTRHAIARKQSTSDFEQGYAANVAPRLPRHTRRALGVATPVESRGSSRQASPEKKSSLSRYRGIEGSRPSSPTRRPPASQRPSKIRLPSLSKETKIPSRPPSAGPSKTTFSKSRPPGLQALGKVTNLAKHYDRLGRETERSKAKYTVLRGTRARPVASAKAKVEVLESINDLSEGSDPSDADDESEGDDHSKLPASPPKLLSDDDKPKETPPDPDTPAAATLPDETTPPATATTTEGSVADPGQELVVPPALEPPLFPPSPFLEPGKPSNEPLTPPYQSDNESVLKPEPSILQTISKIWKQNQNVWDDLGDPEHIFRDSDMVVRLDEPTSIIALALNSPQYREMLANSRADKRTAKVESSLFEGTEAFMPDDGSVAESTSTWGMVNMDAADTIGSHEDPRSFSSRLPWAITFESGGLTLSCTVLYPEQFDAIRKMFDCEKSIVESLARCVKWNASGGKSGSAFLKTQDDRFIAKELSRAELQTMETFGPAYFEYMSSAVTANRPTLLAKVFGCYKLTIKRKDRQPGKARSTQMNLLVMENLFYDRSFARIYDLKGSTRNRHVDSTGRANEVLLDENLVEAAQTSPFYLREHSKRILRGALYNDSKFLADINVMDYSLVCGVDSDGHELVLGIVDYIRTYTWDKKLETWVKETAFLGGGGKGEPTIVTPRQYRQRFLSAMERYFPLVPDRWMKHKDSPEEESPTLSDLWQDWL